MLIASTIAFKGPVAGPPWALYERGEKAKTRRIAKMGISQARMSEASPVFTSWKVMYSVGLSTPWPARMEMMN